MRTASARAAGKRGGVLVSIVVLTAIASLGAGAMIATTISYRRVAMSAYERDRAFYLAEAGLAAALTRLNAYGETEANISFAQSPRFFAGTNDLGSRPWGFETTVTLGSNGQYTISSRGRFNRSVATVASLIGKQGGNRTIHALYAHALYAGNSSGATNYVLKIGGTGTGADFVRGDVYSGCDIEVSGAAKLRLPELLGDTDGDGIQNLDETWDEALARQTFDTPLTPSEFTTYSNSMSAYMGAVYNNGLYDEGEAYIDTIGNGYYDEGEPFTDVSGGTPGVRDPGDDFTDLNGNHVRDPGEPFVDQGNGVYDTGEEWIEDTTHKISGTKVRVNGRYDPAGGYWKYSSYYRRWTWTANSTTASWPAEDFEDLPDGIYEPGEPFVDQNGVYDEGERYLDDRNGIYDYGTQATRSITGMPAPGIGQDWAVGNDPAVDPPDLQHMYYSAPKTGAEPSGALPRWGYDVAVTASDYGTAKGITDASRPEHIFVRNPNTSGSGSSLPNGKTVGVRSYTPLYTTGGQRIDDYFFEDPADPDYNSATAPAICKNDNVRKSDGTYYNNVTDSMYITVRPEHNAKLYYVDGNLYIHHPSAFSFRFRNAGTRITIVAKGNITISDEFYYNADYPTGANQIDYAAFNSTKVPNPKDALCLIALKNPACANSGNVYIGDAQFGTGGAIHAMLYAENNFVDNNLNSSAQPYISIYGNMTAGNHVSIMRTGTNRTRLDISLDERIRNGDITLPGLPHPLGTQRRIELNYCWGIVPGSWASYSKLQ